MSGHSVSLQPWRHARRVFLTASCGLILTPSAALAQAAEESPPDSIVLTGIVRDFHEQTHPQGHPDFEQSPAGGFAQYSGNVSLIRATDRKPVFTGEGHKINYPSKDSSGRPIAPHLTNHYYGVGTAEQIAGSSIILQDSHETDAYVITFVSATAHEDGTSTWVYRVEELPSGMDLSHWDLRLDPSHTVLSSGTTPGYEVGVDGSTGFYGIKWDVTDPFASGDFHVHLDKVYVGENMNVSVLAKGGPQADVGDLFAPGVQVTTTGSPYPEGNLIYNPSLGDTTATYGVSGTGGILNSDSFRTWFRDEPGVNLSTTIFIELVRQLDGTYVFDDSTDPQYSSLGGFFPIDEQLLGNPGGVPDHNYHFTVEFHATFVYDSSADQYLRFEGDDDVWMYIDCKLAIDIGGIHAQIDQYIDFDRLGLVDGETYDLDFFFAERHRTRSDFRIETNVELENLELPTMFAAFD